MQQSQKQQRGLWRLSQRQQHGPGFATPTALLLTQPAKSDLPLLLLLPTLLLLKPLLLLTSQMATLGLPGKGQGPGTMDQGPGTKDQDPGTKDQGPGTRDQDLATTWSCSWASLLLYFFSDTNVGLVKTGNLAFFDLEFTNVELRPQCRPELLVFYFYKFQQ